MQEVMVPILVFLSVAFIGSAVLVGRSARRARLQARLSAGSDVGSETGTPRSEWLLGLLGRLGSTVSAGEHSRLLRENLARAGYHEDSAPAVYLGAKMILLVLGMVGSLLALVQVNLPLASKVVIVLLVTALLFFVPNIVVYVRRQKRRMEIRRHLPEAIDLLEVCVSAGMGIDMAWNAVSEEIRRVSGHLADEMTLTNLELHLGATRVVAMRHMADRCGAEELRSLVTVLFQSERFGTSVGDALRDFAASMRETRSAQAEEASEKTAVKLLFPMVVLIFPAIIIVVVGPAGIRLAEFVMSG